MMRCKNLGSFEIFSRPFLRIPSHEWKSKNLSRPFTIIFFSFVTKNRLSIDCRMAAKSVSQIEKSLKAT